MPTAARLIAGGALAGLLIVAPMEAQRSAAAAAAVRAGEADSNVLAVALFALLAGILYVAARKRLA